MTEWECKGLTTPRPVYCVFCLSVRIHFLWLIVSFWTACSWLVVHPILNSLFFSFVWESQSPQSIRISAVLRVVVAIFFIFFQLMKKGDSNEWFYGSFVYNMAISRCTVGYSAVDFSMMQRSGFIVQVPLHIMIPSLIPLPVCFRF